MRIIFEDDKEVAWETGKALSAIERAYVSILKKYLSEILDDVMEKAIKEICDISDTYHEVYEEYVLEPTLTKLDREVLNARQLFEKKCPADIRKREKRVKKRKLLGIVPKRVKEFFFNVAVGLTVEILVLGMGYFLSQNLKAPNTDAKEVTEYTVESESLHDEISVKGEVSFSFGVTAKFCFD